MIRKVVAALIGTYLGFFGLLAALQARVIFHPPEVPAVALTAAAARLGAREVALDLPDGTRALAWFRPSGEHAHGLYVYFHGNGGTVAASLDVTDAAITRGFDALHVSYPGYPGGTGSPSEAGVREAGRAAWRWATETQGYPPDHIVLHGQSLGGGAVGLLLADARPGAVILESTFDSVVNVAGDRFPFYPVSLAVTHRFDTAANAANWRGPTLILHATDDPVVRFPRGEALHRALPFATFVRIASDAHNARWTLDDPRGRAAWEALLDGVGG